MLSFVYAQFSQLLVRPGKIPVAVVNICKEDVMTTVAMVRLYCSWDKYMSGVSVFPQLW